MNTKKIVINKNVLEFVITNVTSNGTLVAFVGHISPQIMLMLDRFAAQSTGFYNVDGDTKL